MRFGSSKLGRVSVTVRGFDIERDDDLVYEFLVSTFNFDSMNSYLLPAYWAYGLLHPFFKPELSNLIGLWESDGELVGVATYEWYPGEAQLHVHSDFTYLLPDMLRYAEQHLSSTDDGVKELAIWITDAETEKRQMLQSSGYTLTQTEVVQLYDLTKPFPRVALPPGFRVITGAEIDSERLAKFWWEAFENTEDMPDRQRDWVARWRTSRHSNPELLTAIVAPDGEYACGLGMWVDQANRFAYLEPLATLPKYRGLGLAAYALVETMKRAKDLGAVICDGGSNPFYNQLGFTPHLKRERWARNE